MTMSAPFLRLINVTKKYESGSQHLTILNAVNLEIRSGEAFAVIGPSGSGKSTLLNILGTLDRPTEGQVLIDGREVSALPEADLADVRSSQIGFIFQSHHLLPQCTALENVLVPVLARGSTDAAEPRARELLERVGLSERLDHFPGQLSGGERQRVAVVRALINQPKLVLADEPTGALDEASADHLANLLVELNRELSTALVVVTHAAALADLMPNRLELRNGQLKPGVSGV